nr:MFS transporter [Pseudalkalibacillus caeni]
MKKKWDLFALASIPLVMTLGNSMLIPVLPTMEKEIGITPFQSSMIITVYSIVAILLIPFAGYISDRIGRKKVIIPSLIITGLGGALSAFAAWKLNNPYTVILIGRFLQGIGAAGAFPVVLPTVGDLFKKDEEISKGLGIIETSNTFGKVLSPILGAILAAIIWFIPFVSIPIFSLVSVLLMLFLVKPPVNDEEKVTFKKFAYSIKGIFSKNWRWLSSVFLIGCFNMFILFGFLFHLSSILESKFGINGISKGGILAIPLFVLCLASYYTGKKIGKNKNIMKWTIFIGNLTCGVTLLLIKPGASLLMIITLLSFGSAGIGVSLPCLDALITEGIDKQERGTITSIYSSMRFIGVAAGPPVVATLMGFSFNLVYLCLAVFSVLGSLLTFFAIKPDPSPEKRGLADKLDKLDVPNTLFASKK